MGHPFIATWIASPMNVWPSDAVLPAFYNQTLREIMRVSLGGSRVRARLTNEFGTAPLAIDAVHLAIAGEDGAIQPSSDRVLTFGGLPAAVIPAGAALLSDPVDLPVAPLTRLAVSVFVRGFMPVHTHHYEAQQTTYVSIPGNFAGATLMPVEQLTTSRYLTTAIFIDATPAARAVVCFGDSITDGYGSSLDRDARWPDALAERLQAMPGMDEVAVLNAGIGGNRVFHDGRGPKGLARFDRNVLSLPRLSHVVILEGINDIGWPNTILAGPDQTVSAATLVGGLGQFVMRGQTAGAKVLLGTLTPFEGTRSDAPVHAFHSAEKEKTRQAVNRWIRTQTLADGVIDFDAALRHPNAPGRLRPVLDCGDHIHPNDDGYRAMAAAIEPRLLE